jgi:hypothetical protein
MLLWDGTARVPLAVLSDGPIGHKRQFCDTKTPSRILSSEKGRLLKFGYKINYALRAHILRGFPGVCRYREAHPSA